MPVSYTHLLLACALVFSGVVLAQGATQPAAAAQPANQLGQKAIRRLLLSSPLVRPFSAYRAANWLAARPAVKTTGVHAFGFQPFVRPLAITDDDWLGGAVINGGAVGDTGTGGLQLAGATINAPVTNSSAGTIEVITGTTNTIGTLTNAAGGQVKIDNNSTLTLTCLLYTSRCV